MGDSEMAIHRVIVVHLETNLGSRQLGERAHSSDIRYNPAARRASAEYFDVRQVSEHPQSVSAAVPLNHSRPLPV